MVAKWLQEPQLWYLYTKKAKDERGAEYVSAVPPLFESVENFPWNLIAESPDLALSRIIMISHVFLKSAWFGELAWLV